MHSLIPSYQDRAIPSRTQSFRLFVARPRDRRMVRKNPDGLDYKAAKERFRKNSLRSQKTNSAAPTRRTVYHNCFFYVRPRRQIKFSGPGVQQEFHPSYFVHHSRLNKFYNAVKEIKGMRARTSAKGCKSTEHRGS